MTPGRRLLGLFLLGLFLSGVWGCQQGSVDSNQQTATGPAAEDALEWHMTRLRRAIADFSVGSVATAKVRREVEYRFEPAASGAARPTAWVTIRTYETLEQPSELSESGSETRDSGILSAVPVDSESSSRLGAGTASGNEALSEERTYQLEFADNDRWKLGSTLDNQWEKLSFDYALSLGDEFAVQPENEPVDAEAPVTPE